MTRNALVIPNPDGSDTVSYTTILLDRAPDSGGSPGAWAQIASLAIDTINENTKYIDPSGTLTSWYRWHFTDGITPSDTSLAIQMGSYLVRTWIKNDVPDATDLNDNVLWDQWKDQTLIDMQSEGLGRPSDVQEFTPSVPTDYFVNLRSDIRRVTRVEIWSTIDGLYWTDIRAWEQYRRGRQVRIMHPKRGFTYKIYGVSEFQTIDDLDDELFNVLYWGIRWRYMKFREGERTSMRPFLSRTRQSDTTSQMDFKRLADDAKLEFVERVGKLLANEEIPSGGAA